MPVGVVRDNRKPTDNIVTHITCFFNAYYSFRTCLPVSGAASLLFFQTIPNLVSESPMRTSAKTT